MQKLIAFELYTRRDSGQYDLLMTDTVTGIGVTRTVDVDTRIAKMERACTRRVEELVAGLERHGIHTIECGAMAKPPGECDCGLSKLMVPGAGK